MKSAAGTSAPDVVIIGAGMAGLTCANYLHRQGSAPLVLEKSDQVGGRVRTDEVDGFLLDRGFQVFLPAYPEAKSLLDYERLDLRPFYPGALVWTGDRLARLTDPFRRPADLRGHLFSSIPTITDKFKIAQLRKLNLSDIPQESANRLTTYEELVEFGFSEKVIEHFFRPFLAGIFLDSKLRASGAFFRFVIRMFAESQASVPARGMGEIPRQLASNLPASSVRLNAPVAKVDNGTVILETGERIECDTVVVATEVGSANRFGAHTADPTCRGVTCLYYETEKAPVRKPFLILNGGKRGPINNVAVMDQVSPLYAPTGKSLLSVSVLGVAERPDDLLDSEVRAQLKRWFEVDSTRLKLLRVYRIPHALPVVPSTYSRSGNPKIQGRTTLYHCGDYLETPSINGAMTSGRIVAESIARSRNSHVQARATA